MEDLGEREVLFRRVAGEVEAFLLSLVDNPQDLHNYVENRVGVLCESDLSPEAKALLLESDYSRVQEVMSYRQSQALRWVCVWVI